MHVKEKAIRDAAATLEKAITDARSDGFVVTFEGGRTALQVTINGGPADPSVKPAPADSKKPSAPEAKPAQ